MLHKRLNPKVEANMKTYLGRDRTWDSTHSGPAVFPGNKLLTTDLLLRFAALKIRP